MRAVATRVVERAQALRCEVFIVSMIVSFE